MITFHIEEFHVGKAYREGSCLSLDTKPTTDPTMMNGSKLIELDTHKEFYYDEENNKWEEKKNSGGSVNISVATIAETQEIITKYGEEDDEEMVFDAHFVNDGNFAGFISDDNAEDILEAYKTGKHVVVHFINNEDSYVYGFREEAYYSLIAYIEEDELSGEDEIIGFDFSNFGYGPHLANAYVNNGKIYFDLNSEVAS